MKKIFLILCACLQLAIATAQTEEGVIVTIGSTEQLFAFTEVREITFGDDGMTIVKTNDATVSFNNADGWQIRFTPAESTGIQTVSQLNEGGMAKVFNMNGVLMKEMQLSDIQLCELPKGVYIIVCNGKSFKIQR